ncbi:MAG: hypothetical protein WCK32_00045 [Chlorobiaceae bacterium]
MSQSQIACTIDTKECAIVRLKTSGIDTYSLSGCKLFPFGLDDIAGDKGNRLLKRLSDYLKKWSQEEIALCMEPANFQPLLAYLPEGASFEAAQKYCRIEAGYFLNRPEEYCFDVSSYADEACGNVPYVKHLLLFYPAEPCRIAVNHFSVNYRIVFMGAALLPLLYLSKFTNTEQVILKLEQQYMLFAVSKNGRIEKFSYRQIKNRKEAEYFSISEIVANPVYREMDFQITGKWADRAMTTVIGKETSITLRPLVIPSLISISNPKKFPISSSAAVKAISVALMAFEHKKYSTTVSH